jgi:hypothetical protein
MQFGVLGMHISGSKLDAEYLGVSRHASGPFIDISHLHHYVKYKVWKCERERERLFL